MAKRFAIGILGVLFMALQAVFAASVADDGKYSKQQLDQMLAPIALYPDELLTNVLMGSTYPLDIVAADRWRREPNNTKLNGDALTQALAEKEWDPSIKALVQFPDVLKTMSDKLDWTQKLGDAFLAQQDEVMDEIQVLRQKADEAGNLKSNTQQKVVKEAGDDAAPVYAITSTSPETVYVPVYQPEVVYGDWWYPDYPPYYWTYPGARYVDGFYWGAGIAVAAGIWGWNHCDWHHHDIDIDVDKWNKINVDKNRTIANKWTHDAAHRGPVPYRNKELREKYMQADRRPASNKDFRGRDEIKDRLKDTDHARLDNRPGQDKVRDRPANKPSDKIKDRPRDAAKARDGVRDAKRDVQHTKARRPSPAALDVKRGSDVRRHADRGRASRVSMASRGGHIGGGRARGGRGGGGRRR